MMKGDLLEAFKMMRDRYQMDNQRLFPRAEMASTKRHRLETSIVESKIMFKEAECAASAVDRGRYIRDF